MRDVAIIGGGIAGITAAIYCARYRLSQILISEEFGGQINKTHRIENYPGFNSISGTELAKRFREQLSFNNVEIASEKAVGIRKREGSSFRINDAYDAKSVILAMGMKKRELNIPGEKDFIGRGVSYCATCDAPFFRGKVVGIVGGNDSAAVAADLLSKHASRVFIIYRKEKIRAEPFWVEEIEKNDKIEIIPKANVVEIRGDTMVSSVMLDSGKELKLDGLFIEIGNVPSTVLVKELGAERDKDGFLVVDGFQGTNIDGVFGAGDLTTTGKRMHQIVTAAAQGALAAQSAFMWLKSRTHDSPGR